MAAPGEDLKCLVKRVLADLVFLATLCCPIGEQRIDFKG